MNPCDGESQHFRVLDQLEQFQIEDSHHIGPIRCREVVRNVVRDLLPFWVAGEREKEGRLPKYPANGHGWPASWLLDFR